MTSEMGFPKNYLVGQAMTVQAFESCLRTHYQIGDSKFEEALRAIQGQNRTDLRHYFSHRSIQNQTALAVPPAILQKVSDAVLYQLTGSTMFREQDVGAQQEVEKPTPQISEPVFIESYKPNQRTNLVRFQEEILRHYHQIHDKYYRTNPLCFWSPVPDVKNKIADGFVNAAISEVAQSHPGYGINRYNYKVLTMEELNGIAAKVHHILKNSVEARNAIMGPEKDPFNNRYVSKFKVAL